MEERFGAQEVLRPAVGGVVHRDHDFRLELGDDPSGLGRGDRRVAPGRDEEDVNRADLVELLIGQQVAQIAEVADVDPVDLEGEDDVLAVLLPLRGVVPGSDPVTSRSANSYSPGRVNVRPALIERV